MKVLEIQQLSCQFDQNIVLKSLNLDVNENEIICLLGASGCGKTTLLKAIAGLQSIEQGTIRLRNTDLTKTAVENRKIGLIFQDYALFPHLTVSENIQFGLTALPKIERQAICAQMLNVVKLTGLEQRFPYELSGGQQQRVAIARALACRPELLLLDEPFSNIDTQTRYEMIQEIKQILKSQYVPAIFVTHSKEEAFAFADKIAIMDQGKITQFGTPSSLYHLPENSFVADFLGGTNYLPCEVQQDQWLESPIGRFNFPEMAYPEGKYQWLLRPEQIVLNIENPSSIATTNMCNGIVLEKLFLGQYHRYKIAINNMELTAYHLDDLAVNDRVSVEFRCQAIVLFQRN